VIINIKEDSIKVITDEGKEQVYIKNKEEVIEEQEQGSSDLTEEKNIEKEKEIDLVDEFVDKVSLYFSKNNKRKVAGRFILFFMVLIFSFVYLYALDDFIIHLLRETNNIFPLEHSDLSPYKFVFYIVSAIFPLLILTRLFIASFTYTIKEIEVAMKWAVHKIKKRREI
jgi:hypothetical protein